MTIGLIAGNGRFPFLVLEAARALGHDVVIIAAKEEAFPELNEAAQRTGSDRVAKMRFEFELNEWGTAGQADPLGFLDPRSPRIRFALGD